MRDGVEFHNLDMSLRYYLGHVDVPAQYKEVRWRKNLHVTTNETLDLAVNVSQMTLDDINELMIAIMAT